MLAWRKQQGSDDTPIAREVARQTGLTHHYWELSQGYIADLGETYTYLVDGMDSLGNMDEFPLSIRVANYADVSIGGLLGGGLFGYFIDPVSANLRKKDVMNYYLWRSKGGRLSQRYMEQVFGIETGRNLQKIAIESLQKCIDSAPFIRGYDILQYLNLRYHNPHVTNLAQLAKLAFVNIYHPLADKEVVTAASQLPASQLMMEQAYRRAMVTHFPELSKIPWTYTLTPLSISVSKAFLKKLLNIL